ncbi:MAG: polyprenyl synthetase family protein [Phycisphaerales bacterium]|nr:polyprenyl synthetase family protein [Phycisphaerales bacterium]
MLDLGPSHSQLYVELPGHLSEVEAIFEGQLASELPPVADLVAHLGRYRGKMLRPTLTLLSGLAAARGDQACLSSKPLQTLAAVIEMIHMATLVHDDVLDEADERRATISVNRLRGNEVAVMLGDYLISNAFHLCSKIGDPSLNEILGQTTNTLCQGELIQLHHREDLGLDLPTYLEIVRRKTAVLVGACGRLGARILGGSEDLCEGLGRYGELLGIAFQVRDDVLDLEGDPALVGKTLGRDLATGKLTLPLIMLLDSVSGETFEQAIRVIRSQESGALLELLAEYGAIDQAMKYAANQVDEAKQSVCSVVEGQMQGVFVELADSVLTRRR